MTVEPTIIQPEDALRFAVAVRALMTEVGTERFVKPHPLRDLLDALLDPGEKAINKAIGNG